MTMAGTAIYAVLALTAKLGAAMAFNVTFMFTAQLYPTSIRFTMLYQHPHDKELELVDVEQ